MQEITKINVRTWSMLGQKGTIGGIALPEIMDSYPNCFVLTADLGHTTGLDRIMSQYNERFINVGIAEQNLVGVAAGIAFDNNISVATTFATFLTMRCYEQIRHNLGYQRANVKLIGAMAGFSIGMFGNTHYSYEDIALMRAIPNMCVVAPADATEAYKMIYEAVKIEGPVYIRLSDSTNCGIVYKEDYNLEIGKAIKITDGSDGVIISYGGMVYECMKAMKILEEHGIFMKLINMHTIKPLDTKILDELSNENIIFTVEEHSVIGGIGSAISDYYSGFKKSPQIKRIGINDKFINPGEQQYVKKTNGIDNIGIANTIIKELAYGE